MMQQRGGAGSDFVNLFYSWDVSPAELSRITLEKIDCAPMFNPLRQGTVFPTGTSGIIPAGVYLASLPASNTSGCTTVECFNRSRQNSMQAAQTGGCCGCPGSNLAETQLGGSVLTAARSADAKDAKAVKAVSKPPTAPAAPKTNQDVKTAKSQKGGSSGCSQPTTNQFGQLPPGGVLANGLGYGPFTSGCSPTGCRQRQCDAPVYYSETSSNEGCTTRCLMPPARLASQDIGCRAQARCYPNTDLGTFQDVHGSTLADNSAPVPPRRPGF
jgi:hypothetical protein